jgi:hypothetical protein
MAGSPCRVRQASKVMKTKEQKPRTREMPAKAQIRKGVIAPAGAKAQKETMELTQIRKETTKPAQIRKGTMGLAQIWKELAARETIAQILPR